MEFCKGVLYKGIENVEVINGLVAYLLLVLFGLNLVDRKQYEYQNCSAQCGDNTGFNMAPDAGATGTRNGFSVTQETDG